MLTVVLFFLFFSLFLYVLLAGADFGGGIIELFSSPKNQEKTKQTIYRVMGPIWEANHIWIIILIVILWIGFPQYFNIFVVYLHIPITLMLLGITIRGLAFIFRHYDAVKGRSQGSYNALFKLGSILSPLFLGVIFGGLVGGNINLFSENPNLSFKEIYIDGWFNVFSVLIGVFYIALCAFIASNFLIGEADDEDELNLYRKKASYSTIILVFIGLVILAYGYFNEIDFVIDFIENKYSIVAVAISGIVLIPLWKMIKLKRKAWARILAGVQVLLIVSAAMLAHFPDVIITSTQEISILDGVAPDSVIQVLGIALLIGGAIILPGLYHLMKSFQLIKLFK
ncbi:cytochrome d ubiquinol oxidase subunit II [Mesonia mobilis]|uniref:Cytochrome D ubiquinol oxidase subunit II n=1 Tax=Mesonia mobilis TaxID=369791 RepID=A0ABQ3BLJ7_9FLAO|nr:cytochrome d ubiquinol oxidase subunit II [Mesonia mobilis]MBQ0738352.1 cytochrome d ubiquinol oxidase subunit II [Aquimarina celericrescens]GGZ50779.1 cytochrome D ubiquinol oxidase subunit II [Mesonia mobilis]